MARGGCGSEGRTSVLLLEGQWFDSPDRHVEESSGKILNLRLLLMFWSAASTISVWDVLSKLRLNIDDSSLFWFVICPRGDALIAVFKSSGKGSWSQTFVFDALYCWQFFLDAPSVHLHLMQRVIRHNLTSLNQPQCLLFALLQPDHSWIKLLLMSTQRRTAASSHHFYALTPHSEVNTEKLHQEEVQLKLHLNHLYCN